MRKINPKSSNEDSFKYSILCSLHYYDITNHHERISELKSFENKYDFIDNTAKDFEIDNPNISLTVYNEDNKIIPHLINNSTTNANIVMINDYRYAAIKLLKNNFIRLKELLSHYSNNPELLSKDMIQILREKIIT